MTRTQNTIKLKNIGYETPHMYILFSNFQLVQK